jgi:hypothetical protein
MIVDANLSFHRCFRAQQLHIVRKRRRMKTIGWILLIACLAMLVFRGINFQTKEKIVDLGPVEINKTESHHVGWPVYLGGIFTVTGLILVVTGSRKPAG